MFPLHSIIFNFCNFLQTNHTLDSKSHCLKQSQQQQLKLQLLATAIDLDEVTLPAGNKRNPALCGILTLSDYLVILIPAIAVEQEQVSDIKSEACLCIGRTRLSSVCEAVCWLITKRLSSSALQPHRASLTRNNRDVSHGLSPPTSSFSLFFINNKLGCITQSIPRGLITFFGTTWEKKWPQLFEM